MSWRSAAARRFGVTPAGPPVPVRRGLVRDPPERFDPQARRCTDLPPSPRPLGSGCVRRGPGEGRWQPVRPSHGVASQRPGSARALARTTPCWRARFSLVTRLADRLVRPGPLPRRREAWDGQRRRTVSRCLSRAAATRREASGFWRLPPPRAGEKTTPHLARVPYLGTLAVRPDGQSRAIELLRQLD